MAKEKEEDKCCKRRFPTFAIILLVVGLIWLLNEINVISVNIPWIPVVLIIIAIGMIINRYAWD
jgi:hypothetical protein